MAPPDRPWTTLVDARTLIAHLGDPALLLLDCRHDLGDPDVGRNLYLEGHIPQAVHAHVDKDLAGPVHNDRRTGRHPLPAPESFRTTCGRWGITPQTQVVAYDDVGGAFAARAWWLLRHYGHRQVAVLDGGLQAYIEEGGQTTEDIPHREPVDFLGAPGHLPTVDAASLQARIPVAPGALLDARDPPRYAGTVEPIDPVAGHIPGALSAPYKDNLDERGRFRAPDELEARFTRLLGGRAPDGTASYCGSGVTAAHNILAMEVAGLPGAALYPGSWSEWVADRTRPVETGRPPDDA